MAPLPSALDAAVDDAIAKLKGILTVIKPLKSGGLHANEPNVNKSIDLPDIIRNLRLGSDPSAVPTIRGGTAKKAHSDTGHKSAPASHGTSHHSIRSPRLRHQSTHHLDGLDANRLSGAIRHAEIELAVAASHIPTPMPQRIKDDLMLLVDKQQESINTTNTTIELFQHLKKDHHFLKRPLEKNIPLYIDGELKIVHDVLTQLDNVVKRCERDIQASAQSIKSSSATNQGSKPYSGSQHPVAAPPTAGSNDRPASPPADFDTKSAAQAHTPITCPTGADPTAWGLLTSPPQVPPIDTYGTQHPESAVQQQAMFQLPARNTLIEKLTSDDPAGSANTVKAVNSLFKSKTFVDALRAMPSQSIQKIRIPDQSDNAADRASAIAAQVVTGMSKGSLPANPQNQELLQHEAVNELVLGRIRYEVELLNDGRVITGKWGPGFGPYDLSLFPANLSDRSDRLLLRPGPNPGETVVPTLADQLRANENKIKSPSSESNKAQTLADYLQTK